MGSCKGSSGPVPLRVFKGSFKESSRVPLRGLRGFL